MPGPVGASKPMLLFRSIVTGEILSLSLSLSCWTSKVERAARVYQGSLRVTWSAALLKVTTGSTPWFAHTQEKKLWAWCSGWQFSTSGKLMFKLERGPELWEACQWVWRNSESEA